MLSAPQGTLFELDSALLLLLWRVWAWETAPLRSIAWEAVMARSSYDVFMCSHVSHVGHPDNRPQHQQRYAHLCCIPSQASCLCSATVWLCATLQDLNCHAMPHACMDVMQMRLLASAARCSWRSSSCSALGPAGWAQPSRLCWSSGSSAMVLLASTI